MTTPRQWRRVIRRRIGAAMIAGAVVGFAVSRALSLLLGIGA